jgi:hypothetical protein
LQESLIALYFLGKNEKKEFFSFFKKEKNQKYFLFFCCDFQKPLASMKKPIFLFITFQCIMNVSKGT